MSDAHFSAAWLRQREPFDTAARTEAAAHLDLTRVPGDHHEGAARVIDLACGTGANFRALAPVLGHGQQWLVVDHDARLLARWQATLRDWARRAGCRVVADGAMLRVQGADFDAAIVRRRADLVADLPTLPFAAATLVTASALLDLVSAAWLRELLDRGLVGAPAVLFALSVDGLPRWSARDPQDRLACSLFRAHQARDKGFGPALGPDAGAVATTLLRERGYATRRARSDWRLGAEDDAVTLHRALIDGIAGAAIEQQPASAEALRAWQARRQAMVGRCTLRIGHVDLLATPSAGGARRSRSQSVSSPSS